MKNFLLNFTNILLFSKKKNNFFSFQIFQKFFFSSDSSIKFKCGIDEAGRGSVLGPLVIAAVILDKEMEKKLIYLGLKDSKLLTPKKRELFYQFIKTNGYYFKTKHISSKDIENKKKEGINLNQLELLTSLQLLKELKESVLTLPNKMSNWCDILIIDSVDVNEERYGNNFKKEFPECLIIAKHKADSLFTCVAAASIIAKVERDKEIIKLQEEYSPKIENQEIGSGYPSDPITISFITTWYKKFKEMPSFVRNNWKTIINLKNELNNNQQIKN